MNRSLSLAEMPLLNGRYDHMPDDADQSITSAAIMGIVASLVALGTSGAATLSRQSFTMGQTDVPGEPTYFMRWAQTTLASAGTPEFLHKIEDVRTFAGKKVCVQGYYRANNAFDVKVKQDFGSGGSPSADVTTAADGSSSTLPSTVDASGVAQWKPFSIWFTVPKLASKTIGTTAGTSYLGVRFLWPLNVLFQVDWTDLCVHVGGERIPVDRRRPVYEEEKLLGRYWQTYNVFAPVSTQSPNGFTFPLGRMRAAPSITGSGATHGNISADGCSVISASTAANITGVTADARIAD